MKYTCGKRLQEVVVGSYRPVNVVYSLILNNGTILSVYIYHYICHNISLVLVKIVPLVTNTVRPLPNFVYVGYGHVRIIRN